MLDAELLYPLTQAPGWRLYTAAKLLLQTSPLSSISRRIILSLLTLLVGFLW